MKRASIKNVPHNLEALTITVSGGNHWAGRQITVGRTRQDDNPSNFALVGTAATSKPTSHPLPFPSKISYCKQTNLVVITIITAVVISESLSNAV